MGFLKGFDVDKLKKTVESGVKSTQENLANINVEEIASSVGSSVNKGLKNAQEGLANINVEELAQNAKDAAANGAEAVSNALKGTSNSHEEDEDTTNKDFITLLWLLASADGAVTEPEQQKINELAQLIDESYSDYELSLREECEAAVEANAKDFGLLAGVKVEAQRIIERLKPSKQDAKLLCWNLLAVANVDGLSAEELEFIQFVGGKAGIDAAVFAELRNYSDAIVEINKTCKDLRQSNRSYAEIEPLINELVQRETEIVKAAQALVSDD